MPRFLLAILGICALCAASIIVAMVAGGRLNPDWTPYFDHIDVCGNQLCILGVVPGITSQIRGEGILIAHTDEFYPTADHKSRQLRIGNTWVQYSVGKYINYNFVPKIESLFISPIYSRGVGMSLGAIVARFGSPCSVDAALENPSGIDLNYPFGYIAIENAVGTQLMLDTKVSWIATSILSANSCRIGEFKWLGFRSWNDYYRIEQTYFAAHNP